ncbi:hypothetical protein BGW39_010378 [Mortierella sp. 14UC]|nr:hypothetical protein BGW39_010378 [Mortierella sp. 14UC]
MSDRSWSPPLDVNTRTLKSVSVIRARPEHLPAIHKIQLLAYPGRTDFHESEDVFRSKLEAYPAGNFVALATFSVVTHDDTSTWLGTGAGEVEEVEEEEEEEEQEEGGVVHGVSVVEITETGLDGTSTTTTTTTTFGDEGKETQHVDIVRARTPDIFEGTDEEDNVVGSSSRNRRSLGLDVPHARHGRRQDSKTGGEYSATGGTASGASSAATARAAGDEEEEEEEADTTILFQWEEPVGYLFSHPYSRESVTLHRMGAGLAHEGKAESGAEASLKPKRIRLDGGGGAPETSSKEHQAKEVVEEEEEEDWKYDHDQWMEKYYVHDCAIHPGWRGQGLASKLWKALEESLTPSRTSEGQDASDAGTGAGASGDLVDTEEEDTDGHDESAPEEEDEKSASSTTRRRRGRRGSKKGHRGSHKHGRHGHTRKGAPNLKEIVLVSVQGTKPFWQHAGGFQVVTDHDMDLSVYGDEAFLMRKTFLF